ncbi:hypothetical protein [Phthorimaea operculella granulovirus]|uniref:Uncharacterized protein n=1 Tax=Phthorimaea operculella granulovirus TaxID=192584 RepID=Q8JS55_9BBAC|nr:hypothetical protein [Phthorimaea operculella granulovirus]AAM70202.1 hypothetical protein [Phthorimaea operculella granulovirus]ANY57393.1 hypothetical protein PhopGVgp004 [Phthorimaea operculella granulovirus]QBH65839.1 hypothetical protein PhopGVgp004 [Phthorimaea operculella granulovirus]QBH65969.1 hypothetical protein PhopGVgp004 [Phthorimaea operculella granulovirus]QBH66099.1 hypothetical protein PhopGVgp004 [Phthorimaea operculella granulovirus]
MSISIFFDNQHVYYNFDECLRLMVMRNFDRVDKKILPCDRLKIIGANDQVYCTDGTNIDVRAVFYDECYITFDGVVELMESNVFGDKESVEEILVACTMRVIKSKTHPWCKRYLQLLQIRVGASFDFYFKVLEQYMLANQPNAESIGPIINKLINVAEQCKQCIDYNMLKEAYRSFDKASALMIQNLKKL